jgi:type I restriction enzyme R subunit
VIANFAVDPDLVFVATQLRGEKTRFLPFNTGSAGPGRPGGEGNPPATEAGKYPTSYLWDEIWQRDNWLDLLERFAHRHQEKSAGGRTRKVLIFPRYHQWHAVRTLTRHAARHGAGHNYLVMASAGSGKSNTIAWFAHRLSSLHTPNDPATLDPDALAAGTRPGSPVFDKVVIITDRRNLYAQLRDTIGSFEQTAGLVVKIDERYGAKSEQLAKALSQEAGKIVTVTLQTFPALIDYLRHGPRTAEEKLTASARKRRPATRPTTCSAPWPPTSPARWRWPPATGTCSNWWTTTSRSGCSTAAGA